MPASLFGARGTDLVEPGDAKERHAHVGDCDHVDRFTPALKLRQGRVHVAVGIAAQKRDAALMQPGQTGAMQPGARA